MRRDGREKGVSGRGVVNYIIWDSHLLGGSSRSSLSVKGCRKEGVKCTKG